MVYIQIFFICTTKQLKLIKIFHNELNNKIVDFLSSSNFYVGVNLEVNCNLINLFLL